MLQRCSSNSTPFSILFPMAAASSSSDLGGLDLDEASGGNNNSYYYSSSSTSVVDCTLSLGTPSTRNYMINAAATQRSSASSSSLCWDHIINHHCQPSKSTTQPSPRLVTNCNLGGDPLLLARRCANCDTTSTPLWRNGPRGPKSLCNACGIRYKKEERRAAASTATPTSTLGNETSSTATLASYSYQQQQQQQQQQYTWGKSKSNTSTSNSNIAATATAAAAAAEMEVAASTTYGLSWRLSVVPPHQFQVSSGDRGNPLLHFQ